MKKTGETAGSRDWGWGMGSKAADQLLPPLPTPFCLCSLSVSYCESSLIEATIASVYSVVLAVPPRSRVRTCFFDSV